jgi:acetylornithine deacetylase/succinyl-diaminopimelate desuccinylase-like protein
MLPVDPVLRHLEQDFDNSVERYLALLRIPSISTDPAYRAETRRAGQSLTDELATLGFEASLRDTPGHPVVVAHHPGPGGQVPHLLYYGHYDVQPPEPLELWDSPPFEPAIVEGPHGRRVVARGAVDDKGQVRTFIEAFRGWHKVHGTLPVRITVMLEGEEETGSPSLPPFLDRNRDELAADIAIVTDTNSWDIDTPAVTYMLRGLLYVEVTLHGPSRDLHSGLYGGAVVNPINALTRVLGQLHDQHGRVQIPGFYDDVEATRAAESEAWRKLQFNEKKFLGEIGLHTSVGEAGRTLLERIWARPTCDLNGIWGGYEGAGAKTVIAAHASAKLSCRLVPAQDPERILEGLKNFLDARTPPDCRWEVQSFGGAPGVRIDTANPFMQAACAGLEATYRRKPVLAGCGGSIPVVGWMKHYLGLDSILVGFGLDDDCIHSPNEKFELKCLRNGILSHTAILAQIARLGR